MKKLDDIKSNDNTNGKDKKNSEKVVLKFHDALTINLPESLVYEFITTPIQDYDKALAEAITDYIDKFNKRAREQFDEINRRAVENSGFQYFEETSEEMVREIRSRSKTLSE